MNYWMQNFIIILTKRINNDSSKIRKKRKALKAVASTNRQTHIHNLSITNRQLNSLRCAAVHQINKLYCMQVNTHTNTYICACICSYLSNINVYIRWYLAGMWLISAHSPTLYALNDRLEHLLRCWLGMGTKYSRINVTKSSNSLLSTHCLFYICSLFITFSLCSCNEDQL